MTPDPASLSVLLYLLLDGITFLCGVLLLGTAWQMRDRQLLGPWGLAYLLGGLGILVVLLGPAVPVPLSLCLSGMLLLTSLGIAWAALRTLRGRVRSWPLLFVPGLSWAVLLLPARGVPLLPIVLLGPLTGACLVAIGLEVAWIPGRPRARLPLLWLLGAHGGFFLVRTGLQLLHVGTGAGPGPAMLSCVTGVEAIGFVVSDSFLVMGLARACRQDRILRDAGTDFLTGVLNRAGFTEAAERMLSRARAARTECALLLLDLDGFKQINDLHGHASGDAILRRLAVLCRASVRPNDLVGRLGGDEFAILLDLAPSLSALAGPAEPGLVAERIMHGFAGGVSGRMADKSGRDGRLGVSIGTASTRTDGATLDLLLATADRALYALKAARTGVSAPSPPPSWSA